MCLVLVPANRKHKNVMLSFIIAQSREPKAYLVNHINVQTQKCNTNTYTCTHKAPTYTKEYQNTHRHKQTHWALKLQNQSSETDTLLRKLAG